MDAVVEQPSSGFFGVYIYYNDARDCPGDDGKLAGWAGLKPARYFFLCWLPGLEHLPWDRWLLGVRAYRYH